MHETPTLIADLAIVLCVAALTSILFRALRQPTLLGYLFAGLIVGPYLPIPVFANPARVEALSELGVILVMFAVGLEFRIAKLRRTLPVAGVTALVQVGSLMWCGFTLGQLLGWGPVSGLFLGSAIAISSTMVVSRVFERAPEGEKARDLVFGVLVIQDVVAIALIAAMTAVAAGGKVSASQLAATVGKLAAVLAGMLVVGMLGVPQLVRAVIGMKSAETLAVVAGGICFGFALLAEELGYSVALGAFIAGILVSESGEGEAVEELISPMKDLFAAVFFVSIGMTVDPGVAWHHMGTSLIVAAVVILGQLVSVSAAGILSGNGLQRSVISGLALGQIGEFAFILAAIGTVAGVVDPALQPVLVTVAVLTTFTTPLLLGASSGIAGALDRLLPPRLQDLLSLYEGWFARIRQQGNPRQRSLITRALWAIGLDAAALTALSVGTALLSPRVTAFLHAHIPLPAPWDRAAALGLAALAGLPLVVILIRNARVLAVHLADHLLSEERGGEGIPALGQLIEGAVLLMVVAAVGFPAVAILRPFLSGPYALPVLLALLLAFGGTLWRTAGRADRELRSGAERLLAVVAEQGGAEDEAHEAPARGHAEGASAIDAASVALPVLGDLTTLKLPERAPGVGRSLGELDLRARTGAAVVAIHRGSGTVTVPTAAERLKVGDVLALAGSAEARARARAALLAGPPSAGDRQARPPANP